MDFNVQRIAELVSLGMTLPTLVLAGAVVYFWSSSVKVPKLAQEWFILGVVAGFIGSFLDNTYWFIPWTASFLELNQKSMLVDIGVFFNIFFRQGLGIFAAYCHLKAAEIDCAVRMRVLNFLLMGSSIAGVFYCSIIFYLSMEGN